MRILKITKKDRANVLIKFDNDEIMILSLEIFMKSGLRKNDKVPDNRFFQLIRENKLFYIKQRAFRLLGRRLHSKGELKQKLLQKMYDKELIDVILDELSEKKYLDDEEFVKQFVREKFFSKKWSKRRIQSELIKYNIGRTTIDKILNENILEEDDYKNALEVAGKKYKSIVKKDLEKKVAANKLLSFLKMKGYNFNIIKKVCEEIIK
jgi:regulatory protein